MNTFPRILDLLLNEKLVISAEVIPPRNGTEAEVVLNQVQVLKEAGADFISVTRGAGGSLRGGTLPIAHQIQNRFQLTALAHFTCRDFSAEEIENELMDHHYFGVQNILALRGDPPDGLHAAYVPKPGGHTYAYQLVQQIRDMNQGKYLLRAGYDKPQATLSEKRAAKPTNFCIGVACYPEHEPFAEGVKFLQLKVEAGAEYAITQMIYSAEHYARYRDACDKKGMRIPILPGFRVLTSLKQAVRMRDKFDVLISKEWLQELERSRTPEDARKIGLEHTLRYVEELRRLGAPGIHVFVMNDEAAAAQICRTLKSM